MLWVDGKHGGRSAVCADCSVESNQITHVELDGVMCVAFGLRLCNKFGNEILRGRRAGRKAEEMQRTRKTQVFET